MQCTRTITQSCLILELSPLVDFLVQSITSKLLMGFEWLFSDWRRTLRGHAVAKSYNSIFHDFWIISPVWIPLFDFCPGHNSKTTQRIQLNFHRMIEDIEEKCIVQEPFTPSCHILELCPLVEFPYEHNFKITEVIPFHRMIENLRGNAVYKNHNSTTPVFF